MAISCRVGIFINNRPQFTISPGLRVNLFYIGFFIRKMFLKIQEINSFIIKKYQHVRMYSTTPAKMTMVGAYGGKSLNFGLWTKIAIY